MAVCRACVVGLPALLLMLSGAAACNLIVGASDYQVGDATAAGTSGATGFADAADTGASSGATSGSTVDGATSGIIDAPAADALGCGLRLVAASNAISAECRSCFEQNCCAAGTACEASPTCTSTVRCVMACGPGDDGCRAKCVGGPDAVSSLNVLTCLSGRCPLCAASSGSSGQSGGSSSGASGGTTPPKCGDAVAAASASIDPLARACLLYVSCSATMIYSYASQCVQDAWPIAYSERYGCLHDAESCADVEECGSSKPPAPEGICPSMHASCDNNVAINCFDGGDSGYLTDCSRSGGVCTPYVDPSDGLPYAGCRPWSEAALCPGPDGCAGNFFYSCAGDVPIGRDCGAETCGEVAGVVGCGMPRPSCPSANVASCSNTDLLVCSSENKQFTTPCAALGLTCTTSENLTACLDPACKANDYTRCRESCDGSVASLCVGGSNVRVDCAALGFSSCQAGVPTDAMKNEGMVENYVRCVY